MLVSVRQRTRRMSAQGRLQKSFSGDERKFLEPLMRVTRGDVRDHIVLHKNDHGRSYRIGPSEHCSGRDV